VHILPFDDSIEGLSGNIFDVYLKPYFLDGKSLIFGMKISSVWLIAPTPLQHTDPFAKAIPS